MYGNLINRCNRLDKCKSLKLMLDKRIDKEYKDDRFYDS